MSLFAALQSSAAALNAFDAAMNVVQTNVTNASTPGYVTQRVDMATTLTGGVMPNAVQDSRSHFAERYVWSQSQQLGSATAQAASLSDIQAQFDVSGESGIAGSLSQLYAAFSSWSASPTEMSPRTQVLTAAKNVAQAFNQVASKLQQSTAQVDMQLGSTVSQINTLAAQVVKFNTLIRNGQGDNAGLQSNLYNTLQQLSSLTSVDVHLETDGTITLLMGGQVPLVVGVTQATLQVTYPSISSPAMAGGTPDAKLMTSDGQDVTKIAAGGQIGGLLQVRNTTVPSLTGNQQQQGRLNQLAQAVADRINAVLQSGQVSAGPPPISGTPLFTYSSSNPTTVAASFAVDPNITAGALAAIQPGLSPVANGIPTQLANLRNPTATADMISGLSYTDYYSGIASDLGDQASSASSLKDTQTDLLNQAENLRSDASGVSLNDQAAQLLQFQQAYEATSKMVTVINEVTGYLMDMIR